MCKAKIEEDAYACAKCKNLFVQNNNNDNILLRQYNNNLEQNFISSSSSTKQSSTSSSSTASALLLSYTPALVTNDNKMCYNLKYLPSLKLNAIFLFLSYLVCLSLTVNGATTSTLTHHSSSHKQHRNAGLYAWNNFTDPQGAIALNDEKVEKSFPDAESSVLLPGSKIDSHTDCPTTTSSHCLRCNSEGCIKCPMYLITDTRQCVDECPNGYIDQWSAHTAFMGRVCVSTGYSGPIMAAMAGMFGGFLFCISLLALAVMMMRRKRRRKTIKQKLINEHTMDRADFLRQLNDMRPNAEYFLGMLNDTRRQIRKLYLAGDINAANAYRPIVRDLARILILLNRPIELIPAAPHDWNRLYAWSEQALERYKPQVGQLIDFFQTSATDADLNVNDDIEANLYRPKGGHNSILLKQNALQQLNAGTTSSTSMHGQKMHMFGSLISLHEFDEPRPSDPFGSSLNTLKRISGGNLITDLNASSLWLEDEFYKLGFRPQDEITTEL